MAKNDNYTPNEDYDMSYEEYQALHGKSSDKSSKTTEIESEKSAEASASADSAAQTEAVNEAVSQAEGELVENVGQTVTSKLTPGGLMKTGLISIAKQFGISGKAAAMILTFLGSSAAAAFFFGQPSSVTFDSQADDCIVDNSLMVYNEKYEFPEQEEKDGYARAMYRILASKEITKRWVDDDDCKTVTGLFYFPALETAEEPVLDEDGNPVLDADGNPQMQPVMVKKPVLNEDGTPQVDADGNPVMTEEEEKLSKAFSTEAIIGMISNADAESSLSPDSYEMNYRVGPQDDESKEDSILSTFHHYNWDIYCEQMFKKYGEGGTNINEAGYEYVQRVSKEKHKYVGMGLWGWTGSLAYELQEFCDTFDNPWEMNADGHNDAMYTMSGQLAFLLYSEDWFDYLQTNGKEGSDVNGGFPSLKNFKVKVPSAGAIEDTFGEIADFLKVKLTCEDEDGNTVSLDNMNLYQLCAKMREIEAAWESAWLNYTDEDQLKELEKIREKWDEMVDECLIEEPDGVTVKEWAALNEIYYEVHYWCYFPEGDNGKVDDFVNYPFDADETVVYQDPPEDEEESSGGSEEGEDEEEPTEAELHGYNAPDCDELATAVPDLTPIKVPGVKADKSQTTVEKCWGLDGKPKRIESAVPVFLDFGVFDSKQDHDMKDNIEAGYISQLIWNSDEKDIWLWDLHVEVIVRDQYGRVIKRVSDPSGKLSNECADAYWDVKNGGTRPDPYLIENGNSEYYGTVSESKTDYTYDNTESDGYKDADGCGEAHLKTTSVEYDDPVCFDSRVWSQEEFDKWYDAYFENWKTDWDMTYNQLYPQLYQQYIGMGLPPQVAAYLARKEAGAEAEKTADENGYNNAAHDPDKMTERLLKELTFDILGDIGDPKDFDDPENATDKSSDNDGTSAGGLGSEYLAKDYFQYFVSGGAYGDDSDELQKHLRTASKYWEQFLGTQEDWYPDNEHDPDTNEEHDTYDAKTEEEYDHFRKQKVENDDGEEEEKEVNDFPVDWGWYPGDEIAKLVAGLYDPDEEYHGNSRLNDMNRENAQRHCGVVVNTDTIADTAVSLAWPQDYPQLATYSTILLSEDKYYILRLCTELYVAVKDLVMPEENPHNMDDDVEYGGVTLYSSCDRGAMTVARSSGGDPTFYHAFPEDQIEYCEKSDLWYDVLNHKVIFKEDDEPEAGADGSEGSWKTLKKEDLKKLEPGDLLISKEHIMIYVGPDAVLNKYPDLGWDEYCAKRQPDGSITAENGETYENYEKWFKGYYGRYSLVHASHGTQEDVKNEGDESSRGLMVEPVHDLEEDYKWITEGSWLGESGEGYRVFRCTNGDLASVGPKWAVNAKWITLRNLPKGEIRNGAYINMLRAKEARRRGITPDEDESAGDTPTE